MIDVDGSDESLAGAAPVWAVFGDLMAALLGAVVLILLGVLVAQMELATTLETNVFDGEALFQKEFDLAGTHMVAIGISARLKRVAWGYIGQIGRAHV